MIRIAIVLLLAAVSGACKPARARVHLDAASVMPRFTERMTRVLSEPATSAAFDDLLDAVVADPTLRERGAALFGSIAEDPSVAKAGEALLAGFQRSPALQRATTEVMAANPGTPPDQLGELVGKRIEATWASPPVNTAWLHSWDRLCA
jgi:hypothetical protein